MISSIRLNHAAFRFQFLSFSAGKLALYTPDSFTSFDTNEQALTMTSSQIVTWPTDPDRPANIQRLPMIALPAMPVNPAIAVCSPT